MSEQAKLFGQIREAVTLAETARAGYPGATPRVAALCDLRAAQAYAYDQATIECRRALDLAFDRLGDPPSSSGEPPWCYWLDEAEVDHAIALATPAVDILTGQVDSARVVSHLARLVGQLGPFAASTARRATSRSIMVANWVAWRRLLSRKANLISAKSGNLWARG